MPTENSEIRGEVATHIDRVRRAFESSQLVTAVETISNRTATYVRNSWLYNWLTAEPEPEVIVIDLRETWTVGPFIAILDWTIEKTAPWYRQSMLKRGVDAVVALGERAAETRSGQLLINLLEPPEPPEREEREQHRENDDGGRTN